MVITSSPGPTPSATSARCIAAVPEREREDVRRPRGTRRARSSSSAALRARRQPARAEGLGDGGDLLLAERGRLEAERGATTGPHRSGSVRRPPPGAARSSASSRSRPGREHGAGAVGPAPQRAENLPRAAVDPHPSDAGERLGLGDALDRGEPPDRRHEEHDRTPAPSGRKPCQRARRRRPRRARSATASAFRSTPRRGGAQLGVVAAPEPRGDLHHDRAVRPESKLGVRGAVQDPERRDRATGDGDRFARRRARDGHACASATPNAGGSAVRRSVTVSGTKRPSSDTALTVTSGPSTAPRRARAPPARLGKRAAIAASRSSATARARGRAAPAGRAP